MFDFELPLLELETKYQSQILFQGQRFGSRVEVN